MNIKHGETNLSAQEVEGQATLLASLTRNLSSCCQNKDEKLFRRFGLPVTAGRVLLALAETGISSPSALAKKLGLGRSRLTPLVELLVQKKLLIRAESSNDRRVRDLELTKIGIKVARDVTSFHLAFHKDLLREYGESERMQLLAILQSFNHTLEKVRVKLSVS